MPKLSSALQATSINLHSMAFWQGGFDVLEAMVAKFEALWREWGQSQEKDGENG